MGYYTMGDCDSNSTTKYSNIASTIYSNDDITVLFRSNMEYANEI